MSAHPTSSVAVVVTIITLLASVITVYEFFTPHYAMQNTGTSYVAEVNTSTLYVTEPTTVAQPTSEYAQSFDFEILYIPCYGCATMSSVHFDFCSNDPTPRNHDLQMTVVVVSGEPQPVQLF